MNVADGPGFDFLAGAGPARTVFPGTHRQPTKVARGTAGTPCSLRWIMETSMSMAASPTISLRWSIPAHSRWSARHSYWISPRSSGTRSRSASSQRATS